MRLFGLVNLLCGFVLVGLREGTQMAKSSTKGKRTRKTPTVEDAITPSASFQRLLPRILVGGASIAAIAFAMNAKDTTSKVAATTVGVVGLSMNMFWSSIEAMSSSGGTEPVPKNPGTRIITRKEPEEDNPRKPRPCPPAPKPRDPPTLEAQISINCDRVRDARDNHTLPAAMIEKHDALFYKHSANLEDALEDLQLILVIDRSGSMGMRDQDASGQGRTKSKLTLSGRWTRWDNCVQAAKYLAQAVFAYDKDGNVPVVLFDDEVEEMVTNNMEHVFKVMADHPPENGGTNLLGALQVAVEHLEDGAANLIVVFTDGEPNPGQEPHIKQLIAETITDKNHILFIRMGDDEGAIRFLEDLDDCEECGENVDMKSDNAVYAMGPRNVLLNALFEHLDDVFDDEGLR